VPVLQRLTSVYKLWHTYVRNFPKDMRYTLGGKIDSLFVSVLEALYLASRTPKEQKLPLVERASVRLDLLKFFLQVAWEMKALDNKKYIALSEHLVEVGRMIGGWQKHLSQVKENPARDGE
jgi:hypothetical protein